MATTQPTATLVQITDTHLGRSPRPLRPGYPDSDVQLEAVLADIVEQQPFPELLLVTGDLAEDPEAQAYHRLESRLAALGAPILALAGNHDDPGLARKTFVAAGHGFDDEYRLGNWLVVGLDSCWPGHAAGRLRPEELDRLKECLARHPEHWVLVAVHHPVVPVGSLWLDAIGLQNGSDLLAVLERHPRVRACVFGHIHQPFDAMHGHLRLLGSPSTCVQFLPGSEDFALDPDAAGYRVLTLYPDGRLETDIRRVAGTGPLPA
ncbi:3',5'-cyclic-nucleotide phosphodiesterase [Thioalkalivibrio nitratireducens DSM 14787]|uniref:3',5'-cyclic-nucleotide phosphodiesterase n=1 Tax=Thioalkalivibrio nitratireducens (strain DSM 14787 / UNIQEM 213 / ALEN2) TaxID=1255043 RepID=L0DSX2_THIND|nr:metallophosphoesterase [Thioalkalivibrio nitratireducens]AGA32085.1 3',5'-cyclic-nucleotide phosphodiesterase [Thioalkalivibrio nitratireducens DSM 14787]